MASPPQRNGGQSAPNPPPSPLTTPTRLLPSPAVQATYFATGAFAGLASAPIDAAFARATANTPIRAALAAHIPAGLAKAGIRFWAFVLAKHHLSTPALDLPAWLKGGIAGGVGGLSETVLYAVARGTRPAARAVLAQGARTFVGFSTFTFQWSRLRADRATDAAEPPAPFARCWAYGVVAGGVASAGVGAAEGLARARSFWAVAVPRGALVVGSTIAVQVWCAGWVLRAMDWR